MQTLSLTLDNEQETFVDRAVASGRYKNQEEVLQAAMHRWQRWEEVQQEKLEALNKALQDGLDSGMAEGSTAEVFARVMARARRESRAA